MSEITGIIAIGSDHAGFSIKEQIKNTFQAEGYEFQDFGSFSEESVDYPDVAHPLADAIQKGQLKIGILICGSGNGMAIVANKYPAVRAGICWNEEIVSLARKHNDANILVLPGRFIQPDEAIKFTRVFLATSFEGGRHKIRVEKISQTL